MTLPADPAKAGKEPAVRFDRSVLDIDGAVTAREIEDAIRGLIVKAFVVLKPGYSPSETLAGDLQEHVKRVTAPYKYPRAIEFVEALPKTISGKIRRNKLREQEMQRFLSSDGKERAVRE